MIGSRVLSIGDAIIGCEPRIVCRLGGMDTLCVRTCYEYMVACSIDVVFVLLVFRDRPGGEGGEECLDILLGSVRKRCTAFRAKTLCWVPCENVV